MTTERDAYDTLYPAHAEPRLDTCACGQELDGCRGSHCPRCGTSIAARAA